MKSDFILNKPEVAGCNILVAGCNFGCGSSREHAPWALLDYGFRAVISTEIADIFRNNSLKNGLLPIVVDDQTHQWLMNNPGANVKIDLESTTLTLPTGATAQFPIEGFARVLDERRRRARLPAATSAGDRALRAGPRLLISPTDNLTAMTTQAS